jgi:hypothetical protein
MKPLMMAMAAALVASLAMTSGPAAATENACSAGYRDAQGTWHAANGYRDANGTWHEANGYRDHQGVWHNPDGSVPGAKGGGGGAHHGWRDSHGVWHDQGTPGYRDCNGVWHDAKGWLDANKVWHNADGSIPDQRRGNTCYHNGAH